MKDNTNNYLLCDAAEERYNAEQQIVVLDRAGEHVSTQRRPSKM